MSDSQNRTTVDKQNREDDHSLNRFERNRFFNGKLMTARDMLAEQEYHANRLETLTGHVTGWGIVCGLGARIEPGSGEDDTARAVVEPGVAIDRAGRVIVVPEQDDRPLTPSEQGSVNGVSVSLRYDFCLTESVPAHGSEDACKQECDYNRVRETYKILVDKGGPGNGPDDGQDPIQDQQKRLPVERMRFPTSEEVQSDVTTESGHIANGNDAAHIPARSYHEREGDGPFRPVRSCETPAPGRVFLGHFETDAEDDWKSVNYWDEGNEPRPYVYTNDMLYTGLVDHASDFENPHESAISVQGTDPDVVVGIEDREVTFTGADGTTVSAEDDTVTIAGGGSKNLGPLERYFEGFQFRLDALRKLACAFEDLREQLEYVPSEGDQQTPTVLADAIATVTRDGLDAEGDFDTVFEEAGEFRNFLEDLVGDDETVGVLDEFHDSLPDFVGGADRFESAVAALKSALSSVPDDESTTDEYGNWLALQVHRLAEVASCLSGRCVRFDQFDDFTPVTSPLTLKDVAVDPKLVELPMLWTYVPTVVTVDEEFEKVLEFLDHGLRIEMPPTDEVKVTVRNGQGFELTAFDADDTEIGSESGDATDGATATLSVATSRGDSPITYLDLDVQAGQNPTPPSDAAEERLSDEQAGRLEQSETETGQLVSICLR